jgi:hypothetical protein
LPKKLFSAKGYAEIQIQRPVFAQKKGHRRKQYIENPNGEDVDLGVLYI